MLSWSQHVCNYPQGKKLQNTIGFPFGKPPLEIGSAQLIQAFPKRLRKPWVSFAFSRLRFLQGFQSEILVRKIAFRRCFWVYGKPLISNPAVTVLTFHRTCGTIMYADQVPNFPKLIQNVTQ